MKALTFEQYFKAYEANWSESLAKHLRELQKYHDFVSQDFKPEMILNLFDSIEIDRNAYKIKNISIFFGVRKIYFDVRKDFDASMFLPKTINDFISDCQRAGIELEFKNDIFLNL